MPFVMSIIFGFAILALVLVGAVAMGIVKVVKGSGGQQAREMDAQEARLIQELHQGLARMERRIEALETIILDSDQRRRAP